MKSIIVLGATGAQGGALVDAILNSSSDEYRPVAITRNANSEKAISLLKKGVEVREADLSDKNSLIQAFEGGYGLFAVTFFWEHFSPEIEYQNAQNIAEAAKEAGIGHIVWSTLEDTREFLPVDNKQMPTLQEKYNVPHFDGKGAADKLFKASGVPTTYLLTSFFWENFIYFGSGPQRDQDGKLYLNMPMEDFKLPSISTIDIGKCAFGIFKAEKDYMGKRVGIAGEHLTGNQFAQAMTESLGEEVVYRPIPFDVYRTFDFPGADDLGNMFQFKCAFQDEFCGIRSLELSKKLNPEMMTFQEWLTRFGSNIPIE
jgi:uncharacterized protein YbjT (DUF2867 family)